MSTQGGYLGVAVFFFLSGYGLMESEMKRHLTLTQFIDKRLKRVVFPLVVLAILWIPTLYIFDLTYPHTTDGVEGIIKRTINVGGWFVSAILLMYVVFMTFSYYLNKHGIKRGIWSLIAGTILIYIICDRYLGSYTALSIPIFSVGILASYYKDKQHFRYYNHSLLYLLVGMLFSIGYSIGVCNSTALAAHSAINYIFIGFGIIFFTIFSPSIIFPAILGEASFDIYLIHKKIITAYFALNNSLIGLSLWIPLTVILVTLFVAIRRFLWKLLNKHALLAKRVKPQNY